MMKKSGDNYLAKRNQNQRQLKANMKPTGSTDTRHCEECDKYTTHARDNETMGWVCAECYHNHLDRPDTSMIIRVAILLVGVLCGMLIAIAK